MSRGVLAPARLADIRQGGNYTLEEHHALVAMAEALLAARAMTIVCGYPCGDPRKCGNCNRLRAALFALDGDA